MQSLRENYPIFKSQKQMKFSQIYYSDYFLFETNVAFWNFIFDFLLHRAKNAFCNIFYVMFNLQFFFSFLHVNCIGFFLCLSEKNNTNKKWNTLK